MVLDNFLGSDEDTKWSELLVSHGLVPVEAPRRFNPIWFVHCDTSSGHGRDLDVVMCLLVAVEHDTHAVFNDCTRLSLCKVLAPRVV